MTKLEKFCEIFHEEQVKDGKCFVRNEKGVSVIVEERDGMLLSTSIGNNFQKELTDSVVKCINIINEER